jgi:Fe-S-cluster containining protein
MSYLMTRDGNTHQMGEGLPAISCFRCGICCIRCRPKLGNDEIKIIAGKLGTSGEIFRRQYVRAGANLNECILDSGGTQCPFLNLGNTSNLAECAIHPFRPQACRDWQASLSRVECQEGLRKLKPKTGIIQLRDIYSSQEEIDDLSSILRSGEEGGQKM